MSVFVVRAFIQMREQLAATVGFPDIGERRQSFVKKELRPAGANEDIAWRHGLPPNRHEHFFPKDKFISLR